MSTFLLPSFPTQVTTELVGTTKVCPEIAFADHKGKRKSGIEKKSRKLLLLLQEPLQKFLEADETVLSIFRAQSHVTWFQQYMMGIMVYGLTATVVVITNRRMIQLRTKRSNQWDQGARICKWESVTSATVKGFLGKALVLHFADGQKHRVWKLPGAQAKVLQLLVPELIQSQFQGVTKAGAVIMACPECKGTLVPGNYECPHCRLLFKNEKKMRWLSVLPGAAYFYCRKPLLGVFDLIGESYVLLLFGILTIGALLSTDTNPLDWAGLAITAAVILFVLAIDVAVTIHHCGHFVRDFIPTKEHAQGADKVYTASIGSST